MHFRFTMAFLLTLMALFSPWAHVAAGASALEMAVGPEALVRIEQEGATSVRALGAWGRLPAQFVTLGQALRKDAGLNLLDADAITVAQWLALAEGSDARLAPSKDGLKDLLGYLQRGDFLDWETVADEGAVAPGALLRRDGRLWVRGANGQEQADAPESSESSMPVAKGPEVLFSGEMVDMWVPYQADGGKFKDFAKLDQGMLVVDVPAGHSWGRTGMYSNGTVVISPRGGTEGVRLSVLLDPQGTTDAVVSLVPAEAKIDNEWRYHHVRVGVHLETDDGPQTMTLWIAQQAVMTREIAAVPERFDLVLRPDDAVVVTDSGGKVLLQGVLPGDVPKDGYRLYALSDVATKRGNKPVRMALKRIERSPEPFFVQAAHDSVPDGARRTILFDGGVLGRWWSPQGGDFDKYVRLEDGVVAVDVPGGAGLAKVGIYSPEPVVWLDGFGFGGEAGVTFEFDPVGTTGFVVALSPLYNLKRNDPSKPFVWAQWTLKEDGSGGTSTLLIDPDSPKGAWKVETGPQAPGKVTLRISPDGVLAQGLGGPDERFPWKWAVPNMGFRVYAFSQAEKAGQPMRMALKRITLDRVAGASLPAAEPAEGVAPLDMDLLFAAPSMGAWEPYGIRGADFAKHGRFEADRLVAEVPAAAHSWPKIGIVSHDPVLTFNERILRTPYAVRVVCDRTRTSGVEAVFRSAKSAEMDKGAEVLASFVRHDTGPDAGNYVLSLSGEHSTYRTWSRRVDAGWVEANWNGVLEVRFGDGWVEAGLPGGPAIRGADLRSGKGWSYHMAVTACPSVKSGASALTLERITGGWVTPPGMSEDERWSLVDDEKFDAGAFLDHVSDALSKEE